MGKLRSTPYRRGRAFEVRVRHAIESRGWTVVRAAGSKGIVDLVAWYRNGSIWNASAQVALIQCKMDGRMDPASRARLIKAAPLWLDKVYVASAHNRHVVFRPVRDWEHIRWYSLEGVF